MSDNRRLIAPIVMLTAGSIASITMFILRYELGKMLTTLLFVLVLFYIIGAVFAYVLKRFEAHNEDMWLAMEAEEGEVIEKEMYEEDGEYPAYETEDDAGNFTASDFYAEEL